MKWRRPTSEMTNQEFFRRFFGFLIVLLGLGIVIGGFGHPAPTICGGLLVLAGVAALRL